MEETINGKLGAVPNLSAVLSSTSLYSTSRPHTDHYDDILAHTRWSTDTDPYDASHPLDPMHDLGLPTYDNVDWATYPLLLDVFFPNDIGSSYIGAEGFGTLHYTLEEIRIGFCSQGWDGSAYYYDLATDHYNYTNFINYFDYNTSQEVSLTIGSNRFLFFKAYEASGHGHFSINPNGLDGVQVTPFKKQELGIGVVPVYRYMGIVNSGTRSRNVLNQTFTQYDI